MSEQIWERKSYESWDEAFRGLAPIIRQQSVRVADYTQVLFVQACEMHFGEGTPIGDQEMRGRYGELSYKCGLYHQLGKALVPEEYQQPRSSFTAEEEAVYRKYTVDGRTLVSYLQEVGTGKRVRRRKGVYVENPTDNIPWRMIRESCEQHMERYNGEGFPNGLRAGQISPIAQIVGLAKELDRLSSETKSEHPFEEACESIFARAEIDWSSELLDVMRKALGRCRAIYEKYISYTRTLPETIPLVVKSPDRVMGLAYKTVVSDDEGTVAAYVATPWFKAILDNPDATDGLPDVEGLLARTNLTTEVARYFLYEATDTLLRLQNCNIDVAGIILQLPAAFFEGPEQSFLLDQIFKDQPVPKDHLFLAVPISLVYDKSEYALANCVLYEEKGYPLVLDGGAPGDIPYETIREWGFSMVRYHRIPVKNLEAGNAILRLCNEGIRVFSGDAVDHETLRWLFDNGVFMADGPITGVPLDEDGVIREALARERSMTTDV